MKVVIVGGGIVSAYMANRLKELAPLTQVQIISQESYPPYDRIHLCALIKREKSIDEIKLQLPEDVNLVLEQQIVAIDKSAKEIISRITSYNVCYTKLLRQPPVVRELQPRVSRTHPIRRSQAQQR